MIKTEEVVTPAYNVPEKKKEVITYTCDFCGLSRKDRAMQECSLCKKHACDGYKGCLHWDPLDPSDYPDPVCPVCFKLLEEFRKDFDAIEEECWEKKEALRDYIRKESLKKQEESQSV